ncbi:extracellular solute-binding protein [Paenibacillus nasutitermitis]|uniref:ABC transporter substrate-binding protein n=1 Tax=Paenibacillus nasutitermitis TaxID=1652958 RepID=A0A916YRA4_9BACL|nr:extracellular solute-binding protein [Paenibacillus nasutitermitis]GGD56303.1 ABC transporter substrate-binding protein [Paenibacillus nasutitermitis]
MKARMISVLVIICMIAALAACTKGNTEVKRTVPSANASPTGGTESQDAEQWALPYKGPEVTIKIFGWESFKPIDPATDFGKWVQGKIGNIKLDFEIPPEGTAAKSDLYLASGDVPDIMIYREPAKFMKNYGDGSRSVNLLDYARYMPEYTKRIAEYPHLTSYAKDDKTNYLFFPTWYNTTSELWYMNQDLMDKYNLKAPKNYEEMAQQMELVHKAEPDVSGLLFHGWGFEYQYIIYSMLFGSNGMNQMAVSYDHNKRQWVYPLTANNEVNLNTVKAMREAYANGSLHPDFSTISTDVWTNIRNNGKWLFANLYPFSTADQNNTVKTKFTYMDPPAATGVNPAVRTDYESDTTGWAFIISNTAKNPELAAGLLEFFSSEEFANTYYWGFEGVSYETAADGKKKFLDSYTQMPDADKQSKLGLTTPYTVTQFISNFYAGDAIAASWSDETKRGVTIAAEKLKNGEFANYYGATTPDFTDDVNEKMTVINTAVKTYVTENLTAFIIGKKPIDEWDKFIAGIQKYGDMNWVVEQYNAAPQKPLRAKATERTWLETK